ncbi:MAG: hypothetical protein ACLR7U_14910, partial [Ruthenibacterium lactatiformans]
IGYSFQAGRLTRTLYASCLQPHARRMAEQPTAYEDTTAETPKSIAFCVFCPIFIPKIKHDSHTFYTKI